ncbi:Ankyrin repeat-containing protein [Glarea lozoyensis ATCC 20868]|uniref:Ankyrin repeat-containing protein n=1 Tax=Glarea lozoyensis (strain ATCC 20868 / MF5171) TaxID=1116229 RepID=S3DLE4_GLAL2|nr:Ankyrin repeat-containing protein [Glarea lozoyensis ATCC 20868]EPE32851.1 Ankyrin repeat-containing protein [Glarea lozoyensis ATCC 20868]
MPRFLERNSEGNFSLTKVYYDEIPPYAILSHTWGQDIDEVTLSDILDGTGQNKPGYVKIRFCAEQASRHSLRYFWIDTCCINKSDGPELQEAITSMFRWYRNSAKCYVFLSDVQTGDHDELVDGSPPPWELAFRRSRWFTRGWTLQELIAPISVEFFCSNGRRLGDKRSLERQIHEVTGILTSALQGTAPSAFSVVERLSWTEKRQTKRDEDKVYSLLGIFDVHMPLIYGEGQQNAFRRLSEEVCKHGTKHYQDEVSQAFLTGPKRLKTSQSQASGTRPQRNYGHELPPKPRTLTPEYRSWQDTAQQQDHGGFLWLQGHPGTGKSTIMKFLFEDAKASASYDSSKITISFFFLAWGVIEERSTTGLYRSLLHQLFQKVTDLEDSLEWMTKDGARGIQRNGWNEEASKRTLALAVKKLGTRSLTIFVDALDECDTRETAGMVCYFEELCDCAQEAKVTLNICFSSRHYPIVVIQKGIEVTLETETGHTEDIKQYIQSRLRIGKSKQAESLRSEILEKSSGIFLWVVLVLDILNSEYPESVMSTKKMHERLKKIPPELSRLFEMILKRDEANVEYLDACLKWILFATRPLQAQELYSAIQLCVNNKALIDWDPDDVDLDQLKTLLRSYSKGLAEVTRAAEVHFIHESVRDFLMGRYNAQWSEVSDNFVGRSHELLKNCCLAQLDIAFNQNIDLPDPVPLLTVEGSPTTRENITSRFPLLKYSLFNILKHSSRAHQYAIMQEDFLASFPLQQWIYLSNLLETVPTRLYQHPTTLLYILAERNLADLIQIHSRRESCFDIEGGRYGAPILASLATASFDATKALVKILAASLTSSPTVRELWDKYCQYRFGWTSLGRHLKFSRRKGLLFYLAQCGSELLLTLYWKQCLERNEVDTEIIQTSLCWAARKGYAVVIKSLLNIEGTTFDHGEGEQNMPPPCAIDINLKDAKGRSSLAWAVRKGKTTVVELLLTRSELDVNSTDNCGNTPLMWAVQRGDISIAERLLTRSEADINSIDDSGNTALSWKSHLGMTTILKLVLRRSEVQVDSRDSHGDTALAWASRVGNTMIIKLLLERSEVDVNSTDNRGNTPIILAARNDHEADAELLFVSEGLDIRAKNDDGYTALVYASKNDNKALVELLLASDGNCIDAQDDEGYKALAYAAKNDNKAILKLLLASDENYNNAKEIEGYTALVYAAKIGHVDLARSLLETDCEDVNVENTLGNTPLSIAIMFEKLEIVELLLATGKADLNTRNRNGDTPIFQAITLGSENMVMLLLSSGKADLNAKNRHGDTPLLTATKCHFLKIVILLLDTKEVNTNFEDSDGLTALQWAERDGPDGNKAIAELLQAHKLRILQ